MTYHRPDKLEEALDIRASGDVTVLAGGTDVYPAKAARDAWGNSTSDEVLDISRLNECRGIERVEGRTRLGALATWTEIIETDLPPWFDALKLSAREVGGLQIQNRGTIAGNLCNASPAADGIPPLLIVDASVELTCQSGARELPLAEFLTGYRSTACGAQELVTAVYIPDCNSLARTDFIKLGARHYLVISIVMAAGLLVVDDGGCVSDIRISVGACSAVARRLSKLEARLKGESIDTAVASIAQGDLYEIDPIDDFRANAAYRNDAALTIVRRLLENLQL